jgi:hypothetical protein
MTTSKLFESLKVGAGYFLSAVGGVTVVLGLIALFVGIGMVVTVPILLTVGLASGIYGAYQKWIKTI